MKVLDGGRRTTADQTGKLARGASERRNHHKPNTTECKKQNENRSNLKRFQFLKNALQMNGCLAGSGGIFMTGPERGQPQNVIARRNAGEQKTDCQQDRRNAL